MTPRQTNGVHYYAIGGDRFISAIDRREFTDLDELIKRDRPEIKLREQLAGRSLDITELRQGGTADPIVEDVRGWDVKITANSADHKPKTEAEDGSRKGADRGRCWPKAIGDGERDAASTASPACRRTRGGS